VIVDLILAAVVLALLGLGLRRMGSAYLTFRGKRLVTCPVGRRPAVVDMAVGRIALAAVFREPGLRLGCCSEWPERGACGQECLKQIEAAPEDCLLRTILTKWYQAKSCTCCGKPVGEIAWTPHKPCLMSPDLRILEWKDIQPQRIPEVLQTHGPVCWSCLVAETHTW